MFAQSAEAQVSFVQCFVPIFGLVLLISSSFFPFGSFAISQLCCCYAGEVISDKDKCPNCKGNKVVQEKKVLEVHVEKGMQHGQKIVFQGEADEAVSTCRPDPCFNSLLQLLALSYF